MKPWLSNAAFGFTTALGSMGLSVVGFGSPSYIGYAVGGGVVAVMVNMAGGGDKSHVEAAAMGVVIGIAARAMGEIVSVAMIDPSKIEDQDDAVKLMRGYMFGTALGGVIAGPLAGHFAPRVVGQLEA